MGCLRQWPQTHTGAEQNRTNQKHKKVNPSYPKGHAIVSLEALVVLSTDKLSVGLNLNKSLARILLNLIQMSAGFSHKLRGQE